MKNFGTIFWGVLLICCGIILGGNAMDIWDVNIFFTGWWTLFIIVPCVYGIIKDGFHAGNTVGLLIGLALLCSAWGFFPWSLIWKLAIPCLLVLIGLALLFGRRGGEEYHGDSGHISAFCSGQELRVVDAPYHGGAISATMGGVELDLRRAVITEDITIKASTFMGGIEITFPPNVRVEVNSSPFFGGVDNKIISVVSPSAVTVYLECRPVLGGIELKS
ncbi:MAG: LiaF-related protein [Bacillota bacterium]|nr:LiaF-related protein [Bacillota bacterium]